MAAPTQATAAAPNSEQQQQQQQSSVQFDSSRYTLHSQGAEAVSRSEVLGLMLLVRELLG